MVDVQVEAAETAREAAPRTRARAESGGGAYVLGAPISLADLLALPPDGRKYGRDEKGRLMLMTPDDAACHREPICSSGDCLQQALDRARHRVVQEASIAFDRVHSLAGSLLPPSHHGPKALVADTACFRRPVQFVEAPSGHTWFSPAGLLLIVEFVSPSTWRNDLGDGSSPEEVDRWRTYLENQVPEYWVVNATFETCGLPPRSGLFLSFDRERGTWSDLLVEDARFAAADYRGRRPVLSGRVRSLVLPGVSFDLDALWRDCPGRG